jgi:hypothetical protein
MSKITHYSHTRCLAAEKNVLELILFFFIFYTQATSDKYIERMDYTPHSTYNDIFCSRVLYIQESSIAYVLVARVSERSNLFHRF